MKKIEKKRPFSERKRLMKKIGKKRRCSERKRSMGLDLPEDLVFSILTRLPVRSLLQCKGVSRSWRSIISDPAFAKSQLQMSCSSSGSSSKNRVFTSRFPQRSIVYHLKDIIIFMRHRIPEIDDYDFVRVMGSQDGVVCLLLVSSSVVILYNPTTTRYRSISLLDSDDYHGSWCGFGVHPISQEYIVVAQVSYLDSFRFQVFSLMTTNQATIRREIPCNIRLEEFVVGTFVNGSIHWLVGGSGNQRILRLDLTQELVSEFLTPQNTRNLYEHLSTLRGCLSLISDGTHSLGIWVMGEYGVSTSWTRIMVIPFEAVQSHNLFPLDFKSETEILIRLDGTRIVIFNSEEESVENVYNGSDEEEEVSACVYVESLISP